MPAVLVLDSAVAAYVLKAACTEEGLDAVVLSSDEADLLERIAREKPQVVAVRRTLDAFDGIALCRQLRAHPQMRHTRVILVSASADGATEAKVAGAHSFLALPCRVEVARHALRTALDAPARVIVVDDSRAQRLMLVPALRAEGWDVMEAEDGLAALEIVRAHGCVDLVVSDVEMPRLDGMALCETLKSDPFTASVPVMLVTGRDTQESIARGFAVGANDYLTKPVVLGELVTRARRLLASRTAPRAERVLVVDRDSRRAGQLAQVLATHGLAVHTAFGYEDAVVMLDTSPPQLVVADVDLGEQDGIALAREMRRADALADVPYVLVTDHGTRVQDVRAASAGVQAVVARPYAPERLLAEVERVLADARVRRQQTVLRRYLSGEALAAMTRFVEGDTAHVARAAQHHRTVLFADLAGFTALCESRAPTEVVAVLNAFFDAAVPVLVRHGASIDKFIGDCIMAVYDAEARGAIGAAKGALEVIHEVLPVLRAELGLDLRLRVGINSGPVTVGDIGSRDFRRDFTVIGDVVNVAQRVQSSAAIDEVLLGESTRALVGDALPLGAPRPLQLKGRVAQELAWPVQWAG